MQLGTSFLSRKFFSAHSFLGLEVFFVCAKNILFYLLAIINEDRDYWSNIRGENIKGARDQVGALKVETALLRCKLQSLCILSVTVPYTEEEQVKP